MFSRVQTYLSSYLFQVYNYYFSRPSEPANDAYVINEEISDSVIKIKIYQRLLNSENSIITDSYKPLHLLNLQRQKDYLKGLYKLQGTEPPQDEEEAYSFELDERSTIKTAVKYLHIGLNKAQAEQESLENKAAYISNVALLQLKRENLQAYIAQLHRLANYLMRQSNPYWPQNFV